MGCVCARVSTLCPDLILLACDNSLSDEFLSVFLQHRFLLLDLLVHQRLREHGLVHLIMAVTAITHLQGQSRQEHLHIHTLNLD